jgi:hypothetical protein
VNKSGAAILYFFVETSLLDANQIAKAIKIFWILLMSVCLGGMWQCASIAQDAGDGTAKIRSLPDALGLDVNTEGMLARSVVRDDATPLTDAAIGQLKLIVNRPEVGLIAWQEFSLDDRFAARVFVNGAWVAAKSLIHDASKTNSDDRSVTSDALDEPQNLREMASMAIHADDCIGNVDRFLERHWTSRARELLYVMEPCLQVALDDGSVSSSSGNASISWIEAYARLRPKADATMQRMEALIGLARERILSVPQAGSKDHVKWLAQLWMRLLYCSYLEQDQTRFEIEAEIAKALFGEIVFVPNGTELRQLESNDGGESIARVVQRWAAELEQRKKAIEDRASRMKDVPLSVYSQKVYEYEFEDRRYATPQISFPGYPPNPYVVESAENGDQWWFARRSNQLFYWHKGRAQQWPDDQQVRQIGLNPNWDMPDLNLADEAGMGSFAAYQDKVFALVDSRERSSASSDVLRDGLLVGLKLSDDIQIVEGTPVSARRILAEAVARPEEKATFKGTPLIVDQRLFVFIVDEAKRNACRVACIDLLSMKTVWVSSYLGVEGTVSGDLSNACLMYHEGRLFVASGNGTVVALESEDGRVIFQVNYTSKIASPYDGGIRARNRTALIAMSERIVCAACDADTVFAIDFSDGHVHWVMDPDQAQRCLQMVGVVGDELICIGDRIAWIDIDTGLPKSVVELPRNVIPMSGQVQLWNDAVMWTDGMSIYRYKREPIERPVYAWAKKEELEQWPYAAREPLAFGISDKYLSVVTATNWVIFEAK